MKWIARVMAVGMWLIAAGMLACVVWPTPMAPGHSLQAEVLVRIVFLLFAPVMFERGMMWAHIGRDGDLSRLPPA